ncbi:MAG: dTDP-4-dehydrorhamnose 3,5-epimerase [Pseudomonadota bacterium]
MKVSDTKIPGVKLIQPDVYGDERGYFYESFQQQRYHDHGIEAVFIQDNQSYSRRGVLRGLHHQKQYTQGKLVSAMSGQIFDVVVDIRHGSPTFGQWLSVILTGEQHNQLYVPPGLAHGFLVMSETAHFAYKCTDYYHPESEMSIQWHDPDIGIAWPLENIAPVVSAKDNNACRLRDIPIADLPVYSYCENKPKTSVEKDLTKKVSVE